MLQRRTIRSLFEEKAKKPSSEWTPSWQPTDIEWTALKSLDCISHPKFCNAASVEFPVDPTDPATGTPVRHLTVNRHEQRTIDKAQAKANKKKRTYPDSDTMSVCDTKRMKMTALKTIHAGLLKRLKRCKSANQERLLEKKLDEMDHKMLLEAGIVEEEEEEDPDEANEFDEVTTTGSLSITGNPLAGFVGNASSPIPIETAVSSTSDDDDEIPTRTSN
ncbi:unnamed protein product [Cylindrotheca closterium]|uniref:Uncharacterized protein n=1 Tax=Cylindrotheca closterium TaxID=2856 RepID=A0AAD2JH62_9STRA|nr:unnamed protein product [Cylindrotheca closterium]